MEKKPCPYCEKENVGAFGIPYQWYIACLECGARGPIADTLHEAWDKWNTRPIEEELRIDLYTDLLDAIRNTPSIAQDTVDTLQRIIIGNEQVHVCAHCKQLFASDNVTEHMRTCESNPIVVENKCLRADLETALRRLEVYEAGYHDVEDYYTDDGECAEPTPSAEEAHT